MRITLVMLVLATALNLWGTVGFVVNSGSETLSKIDFETGEVEEIFSTLGSTPNRVGLTSEFAYVVNSSDNSVQKIELNTGNTITNIYIENSSNPYDIIIDVDHAYVTGGLINKVYKIDLETDTVENSITVGGNPAGMAILSGKLYVGNSDYGTGYSNCSVSVVNLDYFSVEETIPVEINPQFLAVIDGNIHVSCGGDWITTYGKICIIDPFTNTVTQVLNIGGVTSNLTLMPNNIVYVGDGFGLSLYAYDIETFEVIYNSSNPFFPGGTMVASNEENLFVLGGEGGQNFSVKIFDINENLLNEFPVGLYATDIKIVSETVSAYDEQLPSPDYNLNNYPNPFNPTTTISFETTNSYKSAQVGIFNIKGQQVKTISVTLSGVEGSNMSYHSTSSPSTTLRMTQAGSSQFSIIWDGTDSNDLPVSSGVYFYTLVLNGESVVSNKCLLLK